MRDEDRRLVRNKVEVLQSDARPRRCTKLPIADNFYRIRAGRWRIFYFVQDAQSEVVIVRVKLRNEATYKDLI